MRGILKLVLGLIVLVGAVAAVVAIGVMSGVLKINLTSSTPVAVTPTVGETPLSTVTVSGSATASSTVAATAAATTTLVITALPTNSPVISPTAVVTSTAGPGGTVVQYKVEQGDNLTIIADKFHTTVEAIIARNNITDPNLLYVGITLEIVVGETVPVATATGRATAPPTASTPIATATKVAAVATPTLVALDPAANVTAAPDKLEPTRPAQQSSAYEVVIPTASKQGQYFHYTCEFDAAWAIFKSYGLEVPLEQQIALVGQDTSVEPKYEDTGDGVQIYGGDIANFYSGNYETNFLARTTGAAMIKLFTHFNMAATPVHDRASVEDALRRGDLVWIKTTVDFEKWVPATWHGPDGRTYKTVLGNDHAVVVAGYNESAVLIRDVLGPTSTNANRLDQYEVAWPTFLAAWGAQDYDGLAVAKPTA